MASLLEIPAEQLLPPPHPVREAMDETKLMELADSIKAVGIIQPLVVVRSATGGGESLGGSSGSTATGLPAAPAMYEIVAGHRRYVAGKMVGLPTYPCMVYPTGEIAKEAAMLHENLYREDLSPAEEGRFYKELIEKYDLTEDALLRMVRQTAGYVYARLDLMKGDEAVYRALVERKINLGVATALNKVADDRKRAYFLNEAIEFEMPVREVQRMILDWKKQNMPPLQGTAEYQAALNPGTPADTLPYCFCCGSTLDPHNLVQVTVHRWELETFRRAVAQFMQKEGHA